MTVPAARAWVGGVGVCRWALLGWPCCARCAAGSWGCWLWGVSPRPLLLISAFLGFPSFAGLRSPALSPSSSRSRGFDMISRDHLSLFSPFGVARFGLGFCFVCFWFQCFCLVQWKFWNCGMEFQFLICFEYGSEVGTE